MRKKRAGFGIFLYAGLIIISLMSMSGVSAWTCGNGCSAVFGGSNGNRCECVGTNYVCCVDDRSACCSNPDGSKQECKGYKITSSTPSTACGYVPPCSDTSWTPAQSTVCSGESFTQTSNCGKTRTSTGTMYCVVFGDGIIGADEECDDGMNCEDGAACTEDADCAEIGDEVCAPRSGDGCSSTGGIEDGWSCVGEIGEPSICCEIEGVCKDGDSINECNDGEDAVLAKDCIMNDATGCFEFEEDWGVLLNCEDDEWCIGGGAVPAQCYKPGASSPVIQWCSNYKTEGECENDIYDVCEDTVNEYLMGIVEYTAIPDEIADDGFCDTGNPLNPDPEIINPYGKCSYFAEDCRCEWTEGSSEDCEGIFDIFRDCEVDAGDIHGTCASKTETINNCDTTGIIKITRVVTCEPAGFELAEGAITKEYQCVETAKLPFFSWISFMISASAIAGIYALYLRKNKKTAEVAE